MNARSIWSLAALRGMATVALLLVALGVAVAQEGRETGPGEALSAALSAACRANQSQFATHLTVDNAAAFRALPEEQRSAFVKRFSLSDGPGKPLVSADSQKHTILRCEAPEETVEFRFGDVRTRENLAFVPVTVTDGPPTEFGLVREGGGWRLVSLGLVLLDIPKLSAQWDEQELAAREESAAATLRTLSEAIQSYRRAFGKLPESLAQLGPAPKNEISPDQASLVSEELASGKAGGYSFRYRIVPVANESDSKFELAATPDEYPKNGRVSFFLDDGGRIHGADKHGTVAAPEDPLVAAEKIP